MNEESRHFLFGLTVGELGFIFFFIMLLIAFFEISDRDQEIKTVHLEREAEKTALARLKAALPSGSDTDLDSVFADLAKLERIEAKLSEATEQNSSLRDTVSQQRKQLEQLNKLRKYVSRASGSEKLHNADLKVLTELVETHEDLKQKLAELGFDTSNFNETLINLVESNSDLKGQLQHLRARGGIDYPPCWPDQAGKPEYTFDVIIFGDGAVQLKRSSGIPNRRIDDYEALPNVREITASRLAPNRFKQLAQPILDLSNKNECRYYVAIGFDSLEACRFQLAVENYFYKYVSRRQQRVCIE
jgi:hypothetical protein